MLMKDFRTVIMFDILISNKRINYKNCTWHVQTSDKFHYTNIPATISDDYSKNKIGYPATKFISMIIER